MGVPWRNLPAYHRELQRAGYVSDAITFKNYFELWHAAVTTPSDASLDTNAPL